MAAAAYGRSGGKRRMNAEINVVPYIDVMLVLLIIFMITAPMLTQGIEVDLPKTLAQEISSGKEPITLYVTREGGFVMDVGDNKGDAGEEEIIRRANIVLRQNPQEIFLVKGDAQASYEYVAKAMSLLQQAGVQKIGFVTDPVDNAPGSKGR